MPLVDTSFARAAVNTITIITSIIMMRTAITRIMNIMRMIMGMITGTIITIMHTRADWRSPC